LSQGHLLKNQSDNDCQCLIDIWRIRNPEQKNIYLDAEKPLIRRRLDYWLDSTEIQDDLTEPNIIPAIKLNHYHYFDA